MRDRRFFIIFVFSIFLKFAFLHDVPVVVASGSDVSGSAVRLENAVSPYLRQHANNPVDWYLWGEEAFEKARREDKPILLSVGYSTCYWCHVLKRETFMQEDAAKIMNENFVNIKIDREVRPDIDEVYMSATQLMTGHGGWPNNVILTPDLKPFFAATYLPKDQWMAMNRNIAAAWKGQRDKIEAQASQMEATLKYYLAGKAGAQISLSENGFSKDVFEAKAKSYDARNGGFGTGQKFPEETGLLFLLSYAETEGDKDALLMVRSTVDHMLAGGVYDHVGGGFHRYATDATWRVPHFEKMLYTQGLMSVVLARLFEVTGEDRYKRALVRTLDYVDRDLTDKDGGFYSAQDAETNAVEGAYYVWRAEEIESVLGAQDYGLFQEFYHFADLPHIRGHKKADGQVFYRNENAASLEQQEKLTLMMEKIRSVRMRRTAPLRDDKILTAWNGVMIYALAEAGRILGDTHYIKRAERAADFMVSHMWRGNAGLYRVFMDGAAHQHAFLEDYAWLARGLMALNRAGGEGKYRESALSLVEILDRDFEDKKSGGYFMSDGSEQLFVRTKMGDDSGALPAGNAVMAHVFAALYEGTQDLKWKHKAHGLLNAFARQISESPARYAHMVEVLAKLENPAQREDGGAPVLTAAMEDEASTPVRGVASVQSKDKVKVRASIDARQSNPRRKMVKVVLEIAEGWHVNANPASLDFLIPSVVDVQTAEVSAVQVAYPDAKQMKNAIGAVDYYEGRVEILATVEADTKIDATKMRALVQVQACHGAICYAPSEIMVPVLSF